MTSTGLHFVLASAGFIHISFPPVEIHPGSGDFVPVAEKGPLPIKGSATEDTFVGMSLVGATTTKVQL